jgi:hypothetical protein
MRIAISSNVSATNDAVANTKDEAACTVFVGDSGSRPAHSSVAVGERRTPTAMARSKSHDRLFLLLALVVNGETGFA